MTSVPAEGLPEGLMARCTPSFTVLRITGAGSCQALAPCAPAPPQNSDVVASRAGLGGDEVTRVEPLWMELVSLGERTREAYYKKRKLQTNISDEHEYGI